MRYIGQEYVIFIYVSLSVQLVHLLLWKQEKHLRRIFFLVSGTVIDMDLLSAGQAATKSTPKKRKVKD
jgi:hypothetical protein